LKRRGGALFSGWVPFWQKPGGKNTQENRVYLVKNFVISGKIYKKIADLPLTTWGENSQAVCEKFRIGEVALGL
jgi:hypothetical protein